ncbi:Do family serine endopeptidase [Sphingomonas sp. CGMCC 1.13654]|uniref:Probable periplasmic serine endoprotease DegP-like n=1 Tax=Sphingomonas chungangi TaxID=2683589 RepID=A0A838L2X2_9SPHN|nr:Do family serine endopeptidase [Sphingomonas chungangi]MVW56391.1 Do family serine endopeptidase [Sphingomonas chungangi]
MRYAYAITAALLAGGGAATFTMQQPSSAQVAQNAGSQSHGPLGGPASFADLTARLSPAVVNISTTQRIKVQQQQNPFAGTPFDDLFRQFNGGGGDDDDNGGGNSGSSNGKPQTREAMSLGSGFIISADGYVVTNNHVIAGDPNSPQSKGATLESVTVTLPDRTEYKAKVVGRDQAADLAVLKIDAPKPLPFVQFGDSTKTRVGDWVIAIGNPFALGGTVTAGIVSAIHRSIGSGPYDRYIQTDAAINSGNSGGPMFDMAGNVVGINSAIYSPSGGNVGIGFAIPAEEAKPVVDILMKGGRVKRGYLGVSIQQIDDEMASALGLPKNHGEIVGRVEPGYAAAKAGIQSGDVIVRVNNQDVTPDNSLSYIVANLPIGSKVPVELYRRGQKITVTAIVGERPPEDQLAGQLGNGNDSDNDGTPDSGAAAQQSKAASSALGLGLQALTPRIAQQLGLSASIRGVVIASVDSSSDAGSNGLKRGDVILSINQQPVLTVAAAAQVIADAQKAGRDTVLLQVQRGTQQAVYIGVKLQKK